MVPRLDSHICDRVRHLCASAIIFIYLHDLCPPTLNIQLHPVNIVLVVSRAVQVLSKYLGPSCHCQTCIRSLYVGLHC